MDTNAASPQSLDTTGKTIFLGLVWIVSLFVALGIGYSWGQGSVSPQQDTKKVLMAQTEQRTNTPPVTDIPPSAVQTPTPLPETVCSKYGSAQKWEYLTAYSIKEGDNLKEIATTQLKDETRVNEILQINGISPLVVGATLYLPPPLITKSSGNIRQVYGKLVEKNTTSWHLKFSTDTNGQGLLIPTFLFQGITNKTSFVPGDCLTILFDDGYKVYTVSKQ